MTDATKAGRASGPKTASDKRNAIAKSAPSGRAAGDRDADIRAGEAAMRDAARLAEAAGSAARPAKRHTGTAPKAAQKPKARTKSAARRPAHPATSGRARKPQPIPAEMTGRAGLDVGIDKGSRLQSEGLHATAALTRSQLAAARSSAALGFRLLDFAMAQTRAQLGAVQAVISTAELQRRVARQAFDAAAGQARMMYSLMTDMAGSSARTWAAFGRGTRSAKIRQDQ